MRRSSFKVLLILAAVAALMLVFAASASALTSTTTHDKGITTRVIWDSSQSQVYKVNVSHVGTMHVELYWKNPNWADFDVYILDPSYTSVLEEPLGYSGAFTGKEIIDHYVNSISPEGSEKLDPDGVSNSGDEYLRGDDYYIVLSAFNEKAKFQVWGYTPQTDVTGGTSPSGQWNVYLQTFRRPGGKDVWGTLKGAIYGGPYDVRPTSLGSFEARLEWPADLATKSIVYDPVAAPKPCRMEQYAYSGVDWNTVISHYGKPDDWKPKMYTDATGTWYGLKDTKTLIEGNPTLKPGIAYHYVPVLVWAAQDPLLGQYGPPKLGADIYTLGDAYKTTIAYKATLVYPENLVVVKTPSNVQKGHMAKFAGTYALVFVRDPDGVPGSGDEYNERAWAPNAKITLKFAAKSGGTYKKVKTVTTYANGTWVAKVKFTKSGYWKAFAEGVDATGLAQESSAKHFVKVRAY